MLPPNEVLQFFFLSSETFAQFCHADSHCNDLTRNYLLSISKNIKTLRTLVDS